MVLSPELQKVHCIIEFSIGMSPATIKELGRGATSAAYQGTAGDKTIIVRMIPLGTNRPVTYQSEFTILRLLRDEGCPVPKPILNSAEHPDQLKDIVEPWAVTEVIKGQAIKKSCITPEVARELGRFTSTLHDLPTKGYGRLAEQKMRLQGLQNDHQAGVCARWCWADIWPFDNSNVEQHPISTVAPQTVKILSDLEPSIHEILTQDQPVLNHSDLHGEHIFVQDGALAGIIDFGVAFISVPAWEFAVMAFYHGWPATQEMLIGYSPAKEVQAHQLKQAQKLAIVVALYKLSKAKAAQAPLEKVARIRKFITDSLGMLQKSTYF